MSSKPRPLSPFMIGPYYRPQLTSVLSISHRLTGIWLSVIGTPLLVLWLVALASGQGAFNQVMEYAATVPGKAVMVVSLFCLLFHLLNGIRHLIWDTGRWLELKSAYASGWAVLLLALAGTGVLAGVLL